MPTVSQHKPAVGIGDHLERRQRGLALRLIERVELIHALRDQAPPGAKPTPRQAESRQLDEAGPSPRLLENNFVTQRKPPLNGPAPLRGGERGNSASRSGLQAHESPPRLQVNSSTVTRRIIDAEVREAATRALEVVDELGGVEGRTIYTVALNEALEPLRRLTLGAVCGRCRQGRGVVRAGCQRGVRRGIPAATPTQRASGGHRGLLSSTSPWPAEGRKDWPWITLAESGKTSVTVEDIHTPGYPLRLRFTCPKCGAEYLNKNTTQAPAIPRRGCARRK